LDKNFLILLIFNKKRFLPSLRCGRNDFLTCQSRILEWKAAAKPLLFTPSHTRNTGHSDQNAVEGGISLIQNSG